MGVGFSVGVGIATALKIKKSLSKVFVIVGDGEMNEGSVWEACMSASKNNLNNLTLIIDNNKLQTYDSPAKVAGLTNLDKKLSSFGFSTKIVDGHSVKKLKKIFNEVPFSKNKSNAIICNTIKGKGIDFAENNTSWHHKSSISEKEIFQMIKSLNQHEKKNWENKF